MIGYSIARVESSMEALRCYLDREGGAPPRTALGRTSPFWQAEFAARPNFPSVADFLAFRREGYSHGMADGFSFDLRDSHAQSLAKEEGHARRTYEIFRQSASPGRITELDEPCLGAPYVFCMHGAARSASFWTNAVTALRVKDILSQRGKDSGPLDIMEIGAGWGCMAQQLYQLLPINNYAIIDLPKNLFLSGTYVSATTNLDLLLAEGTQQVVRAPEKTLLCSVPDMAESIDRKFDVVVNAFSFQEMDLDTVQAYFSWIARSLKSDGVFISFNSHGKAGVRKPSDYPLEPFHLDHLDMFRKYPSGLLNTIPYEMVLSPRRGDAPIDPEILDTLCCLMQFGLGDNLGSLLRQYVENGLSPETARMLKDLRGYFSVSAERRRHSLSMNCFPAMRSYLLAMDAFAAGNHDKAHAHFDAALAEGLTGFARLRAKAHQSLLTSRPLDRDESFDATFAYPELDRILKEGDMGPFMRQFERIVSVELSGTSAG